MSPSPLKVCWHWGNTRPDLVAGRKWIQELGDWDQIEWIDASLDAVYCRRDLTLIIPQVYTQYDVYAMEYLVGQFRVSCPVHFSLQMQFFTLHPKHSTQGLAVAWICVSVLDTNRSIKYCQSRTSLYPINDWCGASCPVL